MMLVDDALLAVAGRAADPDARLAPMLAVGIRWAAALTVPTAFCFGALFPLALAAAGAASPRIAAHVYGANTIGAIAGALAGGLLIVPNVGVRGTFLSAIAVTIAAAAGAALLLGRRSVRPTVAALSLCVLAAAMSFRQSWNPKLLSSGGYKYAAYLGTGHLRDLLQAGTLLYYREGATGTVAVRDLTGVRSLSIDGKVDASNGRDMLTQRMLAHLPLLTHAGARRAAIVGLGSGVTLGSALTYPLEHLDVIEISREVVQASAWFGRENRQPLRDPRVRLIIGDARTHFRLGRGAQYDVIISEPSNPWMAGIAALFTREFFEELRARLAPGGLVCQWTHTYDISRADLQSIVATFAEVFPDLSMWLVGDGDLLLIGGRTEGSAGASRVTNARASPIVAANLGANGITSPRDLMAFYLADGFLARSWSRGAALQVDDRMALEFSAPGATVGVTREDNASELLSRAGSTLPEAPDDLRRAGLLLLNSNAPRRAWSYLSRAVPLLYDDREILAGYVKAAAATGRSPEAEHTLRALVEQRPTVTAARVEYARLLASRGELAGARVQLLSADRIAPGDPAVWEELAATAADAGNVEDLRTTLARLRSIPETPRTLYYAGVLHFLSGRAAEATVVARRATTADPSHAAAWNLLGASLGAAQGPPDEIRAAFARALAADPSDPASYVNLGTLDLQSARMAEAADWFAQALTLDSSNAAAREGLAATQRARRQP
jgi:spermidine synthase